MEQYGERYSIPEDQELEGNRKGTFTLPCLLDIEEDVDDSAVADLRGYGLIGLIVPELDEDSNIQFYVSETETGTYRLLTGGNGVAITITLAGGLAAIATNVLAPLAAYRWVSIHTTEDQTDDRVFIWILKA